MSDDTLIINYILKSHQQPELQMHMSLIEQVLVLRIRLESVSLQIRQLLSISLSLCLFEIIMLLFVNYDDKDTCFSLLKYII